MEKFIYFFRGGNYTGKSPEAIQLHTQKWLTWTEKLKAEKKFVDSNPLQPKGKQITGPEKTITDIPFGENKEIINGYFIFNAKDIADAIEIAKDCPLLEMNGALEVRPIQKLDIPD